MERYLQLCAKDNMFVVNCTTPANIFHVLRRQLKASYRKPLVVFSPKSLLRHPKAVSQKEDLLNGAFQEVYTDNSVDAKKIKTLVFCTGKFYYDLLQAREDKKRDDVALVRLEQLFPLPQQAIQAELKKFAAATDVVWAQEEPRNMGAWSYLLLHLPEAQQFRPATRRFYAAPAAGSAVRSAKRHREVIEYVFDASKDNFIRKIKK